MGITDKSGFFSFDESQKHAEGLTPSNGSAWDEIISPEGRQVPRSPGVVAVERAAVVGIKEVSHIATGLLVLGKSALLRMRSRNSL